jgi:hypothetical protein
MPCEELLQNCTLALVGVVVTLGGVIVNIVNHNKLKTEVEEIKKGL